MLGTDFLAFPALYAPVRKAETAHIIQAGYKVRLRVSPVVQVLSALVLVPGGDGSGNVDVLRADFAVVA